MRTARPRWVTLLGAVIALAAVITVTAALSQPARSQRVVEPSLELTGEREAAALAEQAQEALSANETETALKLADEALAIDSANTTARAVREAASATGRSPATQPAPSAPASASAEPLGPGIYASAVQDVDLLVPKTVRDWVRGRAVSEGAEAFVTFEPPIESEDMRSAVRVLIMSHDRQSASAASEFVGAVSMTAYPSGGRAVTVGRVSGGYTGASATGQVVVAFTRGRYAFEVILTPQPGLPAAQASKLALEIAAAHPAATR